MKIQQVVASSVGPLHPNKSSSTMQTEFTAINGTIGKEQYREGFDEARGKKKK